MKKKQAKGMTKSLADALALAKSRDASYGESYKQTAAILAGFFPDGVDLATKEDLARMAAFVNCTGKMNRYAHAMASGLKGHKDSAIDLINYAAILDSRTDV
jgi:hypothetical protein